MAVKILLESNAFFLNWSHLVGMQHVCPKHLLIHTVLSFVVSRLPWFQYPVRYDIRSRPKRISSPTGSKGKHDEFVLS